MKWAEKLADIVAVISGIFLLCIVVALLVMSVIGIVSMATNIVMPWLRGIL